MLCLWLDGSPVPVAMPQNTPGCSAAHEVYHGMAPIFITTKLQDLDDLIAAGDGEASMVLRRLRVFRFTKRITPPPNSRMPECGSCFARMVLEYGR